MNKAEPTAKVSENLWKMTSLDISHDILISSSWVESICLWTVLNAWWITDLYHGLNLVISEHGLTEQQWMIRQHGVKFAFRNTL